MNHCHCSKRIPSHWKTCNECGNRISKKPWPPHTYIPESEGGRRNLSRRDYDMLLALVWNGVDKKSIARAMKRSLRRVEYHLAPRP